MAWNSPAGRISNSLLLVFLENADQLDSPVSYKIPQYGLREIISNLDFFSYTVLSLQLILTIRLQTEQKIPMKAKLWLKSEKQKWILFFYYNEYWL